jgi:hypothetical protein
VFFFKTFKGDSGIEGQEKKKHFQQEMREVPCSLVKLTNVSEELTPPSSGQ